MCFLKLRCMDVVPAPWAQRWPNPDLAPEELIAQQGDPKDQGIMCSLSTRVPPTVESGLKCKDRTWIPLCEFGGWFGGWGERKQEMIAFPLLAIP